MSTDGTTPSGLTPLSRDSRHESATIGRRVATDPVEMNASYARSRCPRWLLAVDPLGSARKGPVAGVTNRRSRPAGCAAVCGAMTATFLGLGAGGSDVAAPAVTILTLPSLGNR